MKRLAGFALFALLGLTFPSEQTPAAAKGDSPKAALQAFNDYIGSWSGDGNAERPKKSSWAETVEWGWRFKGNDCWLTFKVKGGKFIKSGDLKWLPDKKLYQFTAVDQKDNPLVFEGKVEKDYLTLNGVDPKTKEQLRLKMFNAGDGAFFNYRYEHARPGAKLFIKDCEVRAKKEGVQLVKGKKGPECVVSGGLGTMAVTFKGQTYYVCCGGCRDAFNENPEKYIKEFEAKKGKK